MSSYEYLDGTLFSCRAYTQRYSHEIVFCLSLPEGVNSVAILADLDTAFMYNTLAAMGIDLRKFIHSDCTIRHEHQTGVYRFRSR